MNVIEALAEVYSLPPADVARWPTPVQQTLWRNAQARGWICQSVDAQ